MFIKPINPALVNTFIKSLGGEDRFKESFKDYTGIKIKFMIRCKDKSIVLNVDSMEEDDIIKVRRMGFEKCNNKYEQ